MEKTFYFLILFSSFLINNFFCFHCGADQFNHIEPHKVELPEALAEALEGRNSAIIDVPPSAVVPGKEYSLKVHEVEEVEGQHLAYLEYDNRYLFALVDGSVKAGAQYSFSLLNDKILVKDGDEVVHKIKIMENDEPPKNPPAKQDTVP